MSQKGRFFLTHGQTIPAFVSMTANHPLIRQLKQRFVN